MRKSTIALLALLTIGCLAASAWMWRRAFPIANVEFKLSREEARGRMEGLISQLGHPLDDYQKAITFSEDEDTKRFLELEQGLPKLEALSRQGLNVWYWTARWFRPSQHEEFSAQLDPQGWLAGFSHTIEEERELPSLEQPAARLMAEDFLRRYAAHHPWTQLAFLEESHEQQPNRLDWTFTWERLDLRLGDARYRIEVTLQGNTIGGYSEYLDVPESWTRRFAEKREVNHLFESLAQYATMALSVGALVLLIVYLRQHQLDRRALPWGWLLVFAGVQIGNELNNLPGLLFGYETTQEWNSFLSGAALSAMRSVLLALLGYWLLVVLADAIYREQLPQHPRLRDALGRRALRDPRTLRALGLGIVLAAVALAYVPGFYIVAQKCGAWCPVQVDYTSALSGWFPWVQSMSVGLTAAFGEELLFRVIGVLLVVKLLRWRWCAVVLACTTWAFMHSGYDQMPGYLRGIELTVEGVLWGWVVLRFGVVATLTAHYLFNCALGSFVVFQSPSWFDKAGALTVCLWPIALFAWGCWRHAHRPHSTDALREELHIGSETVPTEPPRRWDFTPLRLSARARWSVAGASLAVMVGLYLAPSPQHRMLALGALDLSRPQIGEKADRILRERGFAPESWRRVISVGGEWAPMRYLLRFGTLDQVAQLFGTEWPDVQWGVRYFRIGEREELYVMLDKHGQLVRWHHSILREAPGVSLDREAALALAREAMRRERGLDPARETLVSESVTEQAQRRDHYFEFRREGWAWGESELRTSAWVLGDEVVDISRWVKVPEAFEREEARSGWRQLVAKELSEWTSLIVMILCGALFVVLIRKGITPWRLGFIAGLFPLTLQLVEAANHAPWFFSGYSTTTPLGHFLTKQILGGLLGLALGYLGLVLKISVALGLVAWAFAWTPRAFAHAIAADPRPHRIWRDALPLVLLTLAVLWAENALELTVLGHWFPVRAASFVVPGVDYAVPWLAKFIDALQNGLDTTLRVAMQAALVALGLSRVPRLTIGALFLHPILGAFDANTLGDFAYSALTGELSNALRVLLAIYVWRFNPLVIFSAYTATVLIYATSLFLEKGGPVYRWDGVILLAISVVGVMWLLLRENQASRRADGAQGAACVPPPTHPPA